jgi:H+/Cl- antiporter ClcA
MEDLILLLGIENASLRGFTFGFVHVLLIVIGYYSGWSFNRLIKIASNGYIAGIIGAALAHVIADLIAALIDPTIRPMTFGIVLGGIIPILFIPLLDKYLVKSSNHIMVGDQEDIKKDIEDRHS